MKIDLRGLRRIELADRQLFNEKFEEMHSQSCECSFVNLFVYRQPYDLRFVEWGDRLVVYDGSNRYIHYPLGRWTPPEELNEISGAFRKADVLAGGQGAPLVPVFHVALSAEMEKPLAILNIGGVANITWIGRNGEVLAFDTGPGNAPVNDWVLKHSGQHMDYNGKLAISGQINGKVLASLMRHKYFAKYPPKSIDRNIFHEKLEHLEGLSLEDGAATATAFCAEGVAYSCAMYLPEMPKIMIVCGGGANNPTIIRFLRQRLPQVEIKTARDVGWNSDALEAEAFAFLAARRLYGLPATYPSTTGAVEPIICGEIYSPQN